MVRLSISFFGRCSDGNKFGHCWVEEFRLEEIGFGCWIVQTDPRLVSGPSWRRWEAVFDSVYQSDWICDEVSSTLVSWTLMNLGQYGGDGMLLDMQSKK